MGKAENTRQYILEKAQESIYHQGYQATSIDKIIDTTNVTKGAFYYHFKNKEEMGLAVIKEVIYPRFKQHLINPIQQAGSDTDDIYQSISDFMLNLPEDQIVNGCPTNNMIQEMAALNPRFRVALQHIIDQWAQAIISVLQAAAGRGEIKNQDFTQVASFIISSYEGTRGMGKLYASYGHYENYLRQLKMFLNSL